MRPICFTYAFIALTFGVLPSANAVASVCFGTIAKGRLEDGVKLPSEGKNFTPYSTLGVTLGRTYVHSKVSEIVLDAIAGWKYLRQVKYLFTEKPAG